MSEWSRQQSVFGWGTVVEHPVAGKRPFSSCKWRNVFDCKSQKALVCSSSTLYFFFLKSRWGLGDHSWNMSLPCVRGLTFRVVLLAGGFYFCDTRWLCWTSRHGICISDKNKKEGLIFPLCSAFLGSSSSATPFMFHWLGLYYVIPPTERCIGELGSAGR